jgi:hypothetical protein
MDRNREEREKDNKKEIEGRMNRRKRGRNEKKIGKKRRNPYPVKHAVDHTIPSFSPVLL